MVNTIKLPKVFTEIIDNEMFYLDGGWSSKSTWFGAAITMSKNESNELQGNLNTFAVTGSIGVGILSAIFAPFAAWGIFTGYAGLLATRLNMHTTTRGVILNMTPAAVFWCDGR